VPKGAHLSRGTPLSLGWRAVSLPQAPAAKSRLMISCVARRVSSPRAERFLTDGEAPLCLLLRPRAPVGSLLSSRSSRMTACNRGKGESGQGIQALRLADAPGGEGSPFAPTRSDCRQCEPRALALVPRSLGLVDGVSCRGSQHRSTDRPTRYERLASASPDPNVWKTQDLGPGGEPNA
jgi:hypothetical protein